jgi:hypothetical protein
MPLPIARASVVAVTAASRSWFCLDDAIAFSCVQPHITGRGKPYSAPYFGRHSTRFQIDFATIVHLAFYRFEPGDLAFDPAV